ncbi:MAG: YkgJ family cysteine cluster protein [Candidatus Nanoarchaeia archaeon]
MNSQDIVAEELAVAARESISKYCYEECNARCCRTGYLLLTPKEVVVVQGTHEKKLEMIPAHTKLDENAQVLHLESRHNGCPNLQNFKCIIHKNPERPKTCKDFPLFIWKDKVIMVTCECPAVRANKLYPYLSEFKKKGYKLVYTPRTNRDDNEND